MKQTKTYYVAQWRDGRRWVDHEAQLPFETGVYSRSLAQRPTLDYARQDAQGLRETYGRTVRVVRRTVKTVMETTTEVMK